MIEQLPTWSPLAWACLGAAPVIVWMLGRRARAGFREWKRRQRFAAAAGRMFALEFPNRRIDIRRNRK